MDIYQSGGGIHFTVNHTRIANEEELYDLLKQRLMRMLYNGEFFIGENQFENLQQNDFCSRYCFG